MASIKDEARTYEPPQTLNIADLDIVSTDIEVFDEERTDSKGKPFSYKAIDVNGEIYRIPGKVLEDLKAILEKKPELKTFSVTKTGEGIKTKYTVIPED